MYLYIDQSKISWVRRNLLKFTAKIEEAIGFKNLKRNHCYSIPLFLCEFFKNITFFFPFSRLSGRKPNYDLN